MAIGIWFPFGKLDTVFQTDYPVNREHPFTLWYPTYMTLEIAKAKVENEQRSKKKEYVGRIQASSPEYLLGGAHLSTYLYPPFRFAKILMATEVKFSNIARVLAAGDLYKRQKVDLAEAELTSKFWKPFKDRIQKLESFRENNTEEAKLIVKVPWFYTCNPDRYPGFMGKHDYRLD